jgi:hypothetical protein
LALLDADIFLSKTAAPICRLTSSVRASTPPFSHQHLTPSYLLIKFLLIPLLYFMILSFLSNCNTHCPWMNSALDFPSPLRIYWVDNSIRNPAKCQENKDGRAGFLSSFSL